MTPPDDPALVRVLASDGTFAPTPEAERFLPLIEALTDADLERAYRSCVDPRLNYEQSLEIAMLIVRKQTQLAAPARA